MKDVRAQQAGMETGAGRQERDIAMKWVIFGSLAIVAAMWLLMTFHPVPGAPTSGFNNLVAALFVVIFGFLFVTVSSRICGLIGTSANPVSGMTIATLMATCAMFLVMGWTASAYSALAVMVGGVVCVAAANAGATSQDLKTGYLIGATPYRQQWALMIGVMVSVFVIGGTLILMNQGLAQYKPIQIPLDLAQLPEGVQVEGDHVYEGRTYTLVNAIGSREVPDGKYLFDPQTSQIEIQWVQGIGSEQAAAPQARLMATVINGILNQRLPWRLVLLGVFLVIAVELLGIRSLAFAVGSYLSIATTMAIFTGGVVRWLAERGAAKGEHAESEVSPGSLFSSGLIAAGGLLGLFAIFIKVIEDLGWIRKDLLLIGPSLLGDLTQANVPAVLMFVALAATLFVFARKKLD
jgi:uncharacterized oligopeptide transporter (OPT) family protein